MHSIFVVCTQHISCDLRNFVCREEKWQKKIVSIFFAIKLYFCSVNVLNDKTIIIKTWIIVKCNSRDLIGLAAMVYDPLYQAREIATIKLPSSCSCKAKSARISNISLVIFNKTIIPLVLVGYDGDDRYPTRARGIIVKYPTQPCGISPDFSQLGLRLRQLSIDFAGQLTSVPLALVNWI